MVGTAPALALEVEERGEGHEIVPAEAKGSMVPSHGSQGCVERGEHLLHQCGKGLEGLVRRPAGVFCGLSWLV